MIYRMCARRSLPRPLQLIVPSFSIRSKVYFLALFLVLESVSWGQVSLADPQAEEEHHSIHGTVINAVTGAPISRALVYSLDNRYAVLTDSEGHFEFTLPSDRIEFSSVIADGPVSWALSAGGDSLLLQARKPGFSNDANDLPIFRASSDSDTAIPLTPEAIIKGRVTFSEVDAAAGITIQLFGWQVQDGLPRWVPHDSVQANSMGEFRFADLKPGSYKLLTHEWMDNDPLGAVPGGQPYGYAPVYYPGVTDFSAASTIELTAGQTFQADLSVTHQPYYPVKIPIASGEALDGMNINVSAQGHRGPGFSLGYNPDKRQIEGLLPNGSYLVEVTTYGLTAASGTSNLTVGGASAEGQAMTLIRSNSIPLSVQEEFSDRTFNNSASMSIATGNRTRTFALHGPRLYLQARLEAADDFEQQVNAQIRPPTGMNDDSLVIENVPPGRYWLRLTSSRGYVASALLGGVDLLHEPLVVGSGSSMPIEIKMRDDNASIEGTVAEMAARNSPPGATPALGSSSFRASVYCVPLPDGPGQFTELSVSEDGTFSQAIAPGSYRVLAFDHRQPNLPYRDAAGMKPYESKGQVLHLSGGEKATIQVHIISGTE